MGLLWLLAGGVRADDWHSVVFESKPNGAQIVDLYDNEIGRTGAPCRLNLDNFSEVVDLELRAPGYRTFAFSMRKSKFSKAERLPEEGAYVLEPVSPGAMVGLFLRRWWWVLLAGVAGATLAARRHLTVRARARRERALETLEASANGSLAMARVGGYVVVDKLGVGGMASVYRAVPEKDPERGQPVAIKVLHRELSSDPDYRERFLREVKICAGLNHPSIVRLYDWGQFQHAGQERDYLVMEMVEGCSLRQKMASEGLPASEAMAFLEPICKGVHFANSRGIVHRDLKPENIMVTTAGRVKVMDFGLARNQNLDRITKTGVTLGTPAYMAPEQIRGQDPEATIDQYAVGVLAYELFTGRLPFQDQDPITLIYRHLEEEPPPPRQFKPDLAESLNQILLQMLEKDPELRFRDLEEALRALQSAVGVEVG
ncbi:MAG: serine/threonine-protein kinase [Vulcanimicrobiota bacterium]